MHRYARFVEHQKSKLPEFVGRLQDGLIAKVTSKRAIYVGILELKREQQMPLHSSFSGRINRDQLGLASYWKLFSSADSSWPIDPLLVALREMYRYVVQNLVCLVVEEPKIVKAM